MKAIMLSRKPKECANILNGDQSLIVSKTCAKCDLPIKVYIYCNKEDEILFGENSPFIKNYINYFASKYYDENNEEDVTGKLNGKVIAKFTLNKVEKIYGMYDELSWNYEFKNEEELLRKSCLDNEDLGTYLKICNNNDFQKVGYAWHINNLKIFEEPKELSEFKHLKPSICGVKDDKGLYQCDKCKYGYSEFMYCECRLSLTKAPQSWCYVEVEK